MRKLIETAFLTAALLLGGCGDSGTYVVPGGSLTVDGDGQDSQVTIRSRGGTITARTERDKLTIEGPQGTLAVDGGAGLDDLGVEVPPGCTPKRAKQSVAKISMPTGEQIMASLVTELGPAEIVAFYEELYDLKTKAIVNDAAIVAAQLEGGGHLNVQLAPAKNGKRDLVIMVTRPRK